MNFLKTAIIRDFFPFSNSITGKAFQIHMQSLLPIFGSFCIILMMSLATFLCSGFYFGYKKHLIEIEKDPFSKTIILHGDINNSKIKKLPYIEYNNIKNRFILKSQDYHNNSKGNIVKNISLFSTIGLNFIDSDGYIHSEYSLYGFSVDPKDIYMKQAIQNLSEQTNEYFNNKNDYGIIVSEALLKRLGYNKTPDSIRIMADGVDLKDINIKARDQEDSMPLTVKEMMLYTFSIPIRSTVRNLFRDFFVCSEDFILELNKYPATNNSFHIDYTIEHFKIICPDGFDKNIFQKNISNFFERYKKIKSCSITREKGRYISVINSIEPLPILNIKEMYFMFCQQYFKKHTADSNKYIVLPKNSSQKRIKPYYHGAYLHLFNTNIVSDHLYELYNFLIELSESEYKADLFQLQILKRYKEETNRLKKMTIMINAFIMMTTVISTGVIFLMWILIRFHKIGVFFAFGATLKEMKKIFFNEMLILSFIAICLAWLISFFIYPFFLQNLGYSQDWLLSFSCITIIFLVIFLLSYIVSMISVLYIKTKMPYDMISYRE